MAETTRYTQKPITTNWLKVGGVCLIVGGILTFLIHQGAAGALTIPIAAVTAILTGGYIRRAAVRR